MNVQKIKKLLAIIFLICTFLPLSRCTTYAPHSSPVSATGDKKIINLAESVTKQDKDFVPIKEVKIANPDSWIFVLPFIWPLPLIAVQAQVKQAWLKWTLRLLELALIAFSIYCLYFWINIGTTLIGGYVAIICILSYLILFLIDNLFLFFKKPLTQT